MKKLMSSALLTVVAVPFLFAAPAAKKVQDQAAPAGQAAPAKTKSVKKHTSKKMVNKTDSAAPASSPSAK